MGAAVQGGAPGELQDRPENKGGREGVRAPGGAERGPGAGEERGGARAEGSKGAEAGCPEEFTAGQGIGHRYSQEEDFDLTTGFVREQGRAN